MANNVDHVHHIVHVEHGSDQTQDQRRTDGIQGWVREPVDRRRGVADGAEDLDHAEHEEGADGHLCEDREDHHGELGEFHC